MLVHSFCTPSTARAGCWLQQLITKRGDDDRTLPGMPTIATIVMAHRVLATVAAGSDHTSPPEAQRKPQPEVTTRFAVPEAASSTRHRLRHHLVELAAGGFAFDPAKPVAAAGAALFAPMPIPSSMRSIM